MHDSYAVSNGSNQERHLIGAKNNLAIKFKYLCLLLHKLHDWTTKTFGLHSSRDWRFQDQGADSIEPWWQPVSGCLLAVASLAERTVMCLPLFKRALSTSPGSTLLILTLCVSSYRPKAQPPNVTLTLRDMILHTHFRGDTGIWPIAWV